MLAEAVNIFCWGDKVAEFVGFGFVGKGELNDDAVDIVVVVCVEDFLSERIALMGSGRVIIRAKVNHLYSDILAIFDFEVDIFFDDGIVVVADDEKCGFDWHAGDLVGLALFNKASELATV